LEPVSSGGVNQNEEAKEAWLDEGWCSGSVPACQQAASCLESEAGGDASVLGVSSLTVRVYWAGGGVLLPTPSEPPACTIASRGFPAPDLEQQALVRVSEECSEAGVETVELFVEQGAERHTRQLPCPDATAIGARFEGLRPGKAVIGAVLRVDGEGLCAGSGGDGNVGAGGSPGSVSDRPFCGVFYAQSTVLTPQIKLATVVVLLPSCAALAQADPGSVGLAEVASCEQGQLACEDDQDNDKDGLSDCADLECSSLASCSSSLDAE
jgi:hypothetical protein